MGNNANVGIGTSSPAAKLDVIGSVKITDGSEGANKVLTSDASGLASWQDLAGNGGIYSGSGSLSGATSVNQGANRINFVSTLHLGFNIENNTLNNTAFTIKNLTDGTPGTPSGSVGAQVLVSAANVERTGVYSAITGTGTGNQIGVWTAAEGAGSGFNRGINSTARNSTGTNIAGDFTAVGNSGENYGLRVSIGGSSSSNKYGLRIITGGSAQGTKYGVHTQNEDYNYFSGSVGIASAAPTSSLEVNGSFAKNILFVETPGTVTLDENSSGIIFDGGGGALTVLLPDAANCKGRIYHFTVVNAGNNQIDLTDVAGHPIFLSQASGQSTETIPTSPGLPMPIGCSLISSGSGWYAISSWVGNPGAGM